MVVRILSMSLISPLIPDSLAFDLPVASKHLWRCYYLSQTDLPSIHEPKSSLEDRMSAKILKASLQPCAATWAFCNNTSRNSIKFCCVVRSPLFFPIFGVNWRVKTDAAIEMGKAVPWWHGLEAGNDWECLKNMTVSSWAKRAGRGVFGTKTVGCEGRVWEWL